LSFSRFFGSRGATDAQLTSLAIHNHHYDPNQPRVPAGHPDGGQWTDKPFSAREEKWSDQDGQRALSDLVPYDFSKPAAHEPDARMSVEWNDRDDQRTLYDVGSDSFWLPRAQYAQRRTGGRGGSPPGGQLLRLEWAQTRAIEAARLV
jgi:hypothetical protein